MTEETNPTPMLQDASTSDDMRSLLTFARVQGPGQGDLDRLAKRLSPLVGVSVVDLAVPGSDLGLGTPPTRARTVRKAARAESRVFFSVATSNSFWIF